MVDMQPRQALNKTRSTAVLHPRTKYKRTNTSRTSSNLHTTIYSTKALSQTSPQANYKRHSQHGQINRPQDSGHFLRQGQDERLRPSHHQPPLHRARHQCPRQNGSQSRGDSRALFQEYRHVEATGTARQALVERDNTEGAELSTEMQNAWWMKRNLRARPIESTLWSNVWSATINVRRTSADKSLRGGQVKVCYKQTVARSFFNKN